MLAKLLLGAMLGVLLAVVFFGGLWRTVRLLTHSAKPWGLYVGSLMGRLVIVLTGLWLVLLWCDWPAFAACLLGFLAARFGMIFALGYQRTSGPHPLPFEKTR